MTGDNVYMKKNKTIFINMFSTILAQGTVAFTAPIFSRMLGTDNYGIVSVFNTWAIIIAIVFPLCVNSTMGMAVGEYEENERKRYQASIYSLGIFSFLMFSTVCILLVKPIMIWLNEGFIFVILLLLTSFGNFCTEFAISRNIMEFRPHHNLALAVISLLGNIGIGLPLVYLMKPEINYYGKIVSYTITSLLCAFVVSVGIFKEGKTLYNRRYWKFCLPLCLPVIIHSLSNTILSQSDRIMLQSMKSNSAAGIYSLAYGFGGVLVSIYSVLNNSWIPFYYQYIQTGDSHNLKSSAKKYVRLYTVICSGFLLVYPEVFRVFASSDYWSGIQIMPILVASFFMMFLYSLSINYEFYYKKTRVMAAITASAAIINILMNHIMIGRFGIAGAALATAISYLYEFVSHFFYVKVAFAEQYPFRIGFYTEPMVEFLLVNFFFFVFFQNYIARWGLAIFLGAMLFVGVVKNKSVF